MTTLNAKANNAYHELIAEYEREHPDQVWVGFDHQRDAFETGWEDGYAKGAADMRAYVRNVVGLLHDCREAAITAPEQRCYKHAYDMVAALLGDA